MWHDGSLTHRDIFVKSGSEKIELELELLELE